MYKLKQHRVQQRSIIIRTISENSLYMYKITSDINHKHWNGKCFMKITLIFIHKCIKSTNQVEHIIRNGMVNVTCKKVTAVL